MDALLLTLDICAVIFFGGWGAKYLDQRFRDKQYKPTYVLTLPAQAMKAPQVEDFFCTVHGLVSTSSVFGSAPTMVYELWAQDGMKTPRMRIPANLEEDVITQLHSAIPGLRIDKEDKPPRRVWAEVQELAMRNKHRGLQPESPAAASRRITAAFNAVGKHETLLLQWVVTGAGRKQLPVKDETPRSKFSIVGAIMGGNRADDDEVKERRVKESELNFKATVRIAAVAETRERAQQLIRRVRNALAPTGTAYTYFKPRSVLKASELQRRVDIAAGSTSWPAKLTVSEFMRVCGWPVDAEPGVGFAPGRGMDLAPSAMLPSEDGIVIGKSTYPGQERLVALDWKESLRHFLLAGRTGVGKSEEMASIARQIMDAGHGLILLEIAGDLQQKVLDYVPPERFEDVIVVDMSDDRCPIPFDTLDQGSRTGAVDDFMNLLKHKLGRAAEMGPWAAEVMYNGLLTIANTPGTSFFDLLALIDPETDDEKRWSQKVISGVTDPELKRWWAAQPKQDKEWRKKVEPVRSRMWHFLSRPALRNTMGQGKSAFTWRDVLLENKILLFSFKGVPDDSVGLACAMLMQSLWKAIKATPKNTLSYLMLDEAAEFMDLNIDLQKMLEQARKHRVGVIMAAQQLDQFKDRSLMKSVLQNMANKVIFDTFADDAGQLAREMKVADTYFTGQPLYEAVAQIRTRTGAAPPVTIKTLPPDEDRKRESLADALIGQSRKLYGTPADELQKQVAARRSAPSNGYRKPPPPDNEFGV